MATSAITSPAILPIAIWQARSSRKVLPMIHQRGYRINNCDITIRLERPKLYPFKQALREHLAKLLHVDIEQISLKAKTSEGLDAVGEGEAVFVKLPSCWLDRACLYLYNSNMSMIEAVILGLLQGVSEFLPVSSSGHLLLAKRWFGLAEIPILFDLALHLATLGAVVLLFRQTIARLFLVLIRWVARKSLPSDRSDLSYIALILIATMITAVMGLLLKDLALPARLVYAGFLYTSTLLIISTRFIKRGEVSEPIGEAGWLGNTLRGIIIGFLQGLAVLLEFRVQARRLVVHSFVASRANVLASSLYSLSLRLSVDLSSPCERVKAKISLLKWIYSRYLWRWWWPLPRDTLRYACSCVW